MGSLLLAAGTAGKRYVLNNGRILLHQPLISGVLTGPATDLDIQAKEILRLRSRLNGVYAKHTGQSVEKIAKDADRDMWFDAAEAIDYGLADKILQKMPEVAPDNSKD